MGENYVINKDGKWLVKGSIKMLVEPSEDYIKRMELEEKQRQEEERNRPLTEIEELRDYVLDVNYRLILVELGVQ